MSIVPAKCKLLVSHPVLAVTDVTRAAEFYFYKLGFLFDRLWGDPPCFVMLSRGDIKIFLRSPETGPTDAVARPYSDCQGWDVYIRVSDADTLCAEFRAKGVPICREPETALYQMREFEIQDVDGHVLCFAHDVTDVASS